MQGSLIIFLIFDAFYIRTGYPTFSNDGRDAFLVMSSEYYDRTCLWSADSFTLVWQENF